MTKKIPHNWNEDELRSLLNKVIDYRGQSVPKADNGISLITARNVREGFLDFTNQEYIDENKYTEWMTRGIPKSGDLLFTTEAPLGKVSMFPDTGIYGVGQRTITLRTNSEIIQSKYLLFFLLSKKGKTAVDLRSTGSTAKGIKSSELKKIKVSYPPLPEQHRIVAVLETWDQAIDVLTRKIQIKRNIKKGLMQQLLTGKKRLPGFDGEWETVRLGGVCVIKKGTSFTKKDLIEGEIPVIAGGQKPACYHNESNRSGKVVTVSTSGAYAGYVDYYDIPIFASDCSTIQEEKADIGFVYATLKSRQNWIYHALQTGGAQPHVYPKDLANLKLRIPKLKEDQTAIANILTTADDEIIALEKKKQLLEDQKKYLLNNLLTGEILTPENLTMKHAR